MFEGAAPTPKVSKQKLFDVITFDNYSLEERLDIIDGTAEINTSEGNPAPSLCLKPEASKNRSLVLFKDFGEDVQDFILECDVRLPSDSLVNLIFRFNKEYSTAYMGRLDSRATEHDAFLQMVRVGQWAEIASARNSTPPITWVHVKLRASGDHFQLYVDGHLVCEYNATNPLSRGSVGFMSEIGWAFIDNIKFERL